MQLELSTQTTARALHQPRLYAAHPCRRVVAHADPGAGVLEIEARRCEHAAPGSIPLTPTPAGDSREHAHCGTSRCPGTRPRGIA